jgi:hypothetical protein
MRGSLVFGPPAIVAAAAGLFLLFAGLAPGAISGVQAQSSETTLAVDANPEGNTSSAIGARDLCAQVASGDTFQVDVTIENVSALTALEAFLTYDSSVVTVTDRNVKDQFLAVAGESSVFDASESVPDLGSIHVRKRGRDRPVLNVRRAGSETQSGQARAGRLKG